MRIRSKSEYQDIFLSVAISFPPSDYVLNAGRREMRMIRDRQRHIGLHRHYPTIAVARACLIHRQTIQNPFFFVHSKSLEESRVTLYFLLLFR